MNYQKFSHKTCSVPSEKLKVSFIKKEIQLIKTKISQIRSTSGNNPKTDSELSNITIRLQKLIRQDRSVSDMWRKVYDYYLDNDNNCAKSIELANAKFKTDENYKLLVTALVNKADKIVRDLLCNIGKDALSKGDDTCSYWPYSQKPKKKT